MKILTYKRHHKGDPNEDGIFGCNDCMGQVRSWNFDAVIGVGGKSAIHGLANRLNWVGVGVMKYMNQGMVLVRFKHFVLLDERGPLFSELAPELSSRMFARHGRRTCLSYSSTEQAEVLKIIAWARQYSGSLRGQEQVLVRCNGSHVPGELGYNGSTPTKGSP